MDMFELNFDLNIQLHVQVFSLFRCFRSTLQYLASLLSNLMVQSASE